MSRDNAGIGLFIVALLTLAVYLLLQGEPPNELALMIRNIVVILLSIGGIGVALDIKRGLKEAPSESETNPEDH